MDNYESLLLAEMKNYFSKDLKRINHAINVLEFTKKIMTKEGGNTRIIIPAAVLHDIGIKECEQKHNSTNVALQEKESPVIAKKILEKINYPTEYIDEILEIIGHHHSPGKIKTLNFQVLYEADWIVNLDEDFSSLELKQKEKIITKNFRTKSGIKLAKNLYLT